MWTKVIGVTRADIRVGSHGQVFSASAPGPIETPDLAHVALAVETGGARLSDESSPLVEPYRVALFVPNAEELQVFPYLHLAPLLHLPVLALGSGHRSVRYPHKLNRHSNCAPLHVRLTLAWSWSPVLGYG